MFPGFLPTHICHRAIRPPRGWPSPAKGKEKYDKCETSPKRDERRDRDCARKAYQSFLALFVCSRQPILALRWISVHT